VIFERSPVDFLAYLLALGDLDRDRADARLAERAIEIVREGAAQLDLIVYLPAGDGNGGIAEEEDLELRRAMDARLEGLLLDGDLALFPADRPVVLEATGTTAQRLRTLEGALRLRRGA
jgi:hypothetical protein